MSKVTALLSLFRNCLDVFIMITVIILFDNYIEKLRCLVLVEVTYYYKKIQE